MSTTDTRARRNDPRVPGTAAHFTAVCREAGLRSAKGQIAEGGVEVTIRSIEGFVVPSDGLWLVNRRIALAGTEYARLPIGTRVEYVPTETAAGADPDAVRIGPYTTNFVMRAPRTLPPERGGGPETGLVDVHGRPYQKG